MIDYNAIRDRLNRFNTTPCPRIPNGHGGIVDCDKEMEAVINIIKEAKMSTQEACIFLIVCCENIFKIALG